MYAPTVPDDGDERCMPFTVPLFASTLIEELPVYLSLTDHMEPGPAGAGSENSRIVSPAFSPSLDPELILQ